MGAILSLSCDAALVRRVCGFSFVVPRSGGIQSVTPQPVPAEAASRLNLTSDLTVTVDHVFVRRQLTDSARSASMKFVG